MREDTELVYVSDRTTICTKPGDVPEEHYKGAVGAYFGGKVILCGGWKAGKQCHEYPLNGQQWNKASFSFIEERSEAAGAMLTNGSWLIIGGKGLDHNPMFSTEMLENKWFQPNLVWPEAVSNHCMERMNSSYIFVAGGEGQDGNLNTAYLFNYFANTWKSLEERMFHPRSGHVCGFLTSKTIQFIIVAGGFNLLQVELFDISLLKWSFGPSLPFEMNWAASLTTKDNFFIIGGEHIGYCSKPYLCYSSDAIYNLDLDKFLWKSHSQTLKLPRSKHVALSVPDDLGLCQETCLSCIGITGQ